MQSIQYGLNSPETDTLRWDMCELNSLETDTPKWGMYGLNFLETDTPKWDRHSAVSPIVLCSQAMEFAPFRRPSHSVLSCLQNCAKNSPIQTIPLQVISNYVFSSQHTLTLPSFTPSYIPSVRPCVCVCVCVCVCARARACAGVVCETYDIMTTERLLFLRS